MSVFLFLPSAMDTMSPTETALLANMDCSSMQENVLMPTANPSKETPARDVGANTK